MNPLTQIKNQQKATRREIELGLSDSASWHAEFKHSAYVFVGGLDFGLTEGDVLAVFSQYGEVVDVHLARDQTTGKSRGFCFLAYEDQRSTNLAVDNLSGAKVAERIVRVEHVKDFKKQKAEMEGGPSLPPVRDDEGRGDGFGGSKMAMTSEEGREGREGREKKSAGAAEPWQQVGSYADLLREAEEIERRRKLSRADESVDERRDRPDRDGKKEKKKHKKEKKEKRQRSRERRSRSPDRGRDGALARQNM